MGTRFRMWGIALVGLVFVVALSGCQAKKQSEEATAGSESLSLAALGTYTNYCKVFGPGMPKGGGEIPSEYWTEPIKALKPVKVYMHQFNVVVVQRITDGTQEGKYIYNPISSYYPTSGDDGFFFRPYSPISGKHDTSVFYFKRKTSSSSN